MLFSTIKLIARPLFRVLFSVEHQGVENVPEEGAVIIAGNHPSYLDPLLVGLPIRRTIRFMAWDALFKVPLLGQIIKAVGAFPVDIRKGRGEAAYREALRVLESGERGRDQQLVPVARGQYQRARQRVMPDED